MSTQNLDAVKQEALKALLASFAAQGHPIEYAQYMATAAIFQTDLELRNAQLINLLSWLKQNHQPIYTEAVARLEETRIEFERRVKDD